jgi:hypothetical protein
MNEYRNSITSKVLQQTSDKLLSVSMDKKVVHAFTKYFVRVIFASVVVVVIYEIVANWQNIIMSMGIISSVNLAVALFLTLIGVLFGVEAWYQILVNLDEWFPRKVAYSVNLIGQLAKYLPGTLWAIVLQVELGAKWGISRSKNFLTSLVFLGISLLSGIILSIPAATSFTNAYPWLQWTFVLGLLGSIFLYARVLQASINLIVGILRRPKIDDPISQSKIILSTLCSIFAWGLLGMQVVILVSAFIQLTMIQCFAMIGITILALVAGQLAFFLPSGIGVREFVLISGVSTFTSYSNAVAIAIVSRVIFSAADLLLASISYMVQRRIDVN